MTVRILNGGPLPPRAPAQDVAAHLRSEINRLKGEFFDLERGRVDYGALGESDGFRQYAAEAALLREYDLGRLAGRRERLAFWINLYNVLVIHGVIALGIRESVREQPHFFGRIAYGVGGLVFTPDDIEHGILRGNRRPPHGLLRPFGASDPRLAHLVVPSDPRIHCALVCASSSCPPINFYAPERVDEQLDLAAAGFVNGPEVEVLPAECRLRLSPIFKWYAADFGGHEGVIAFLILHRDPGETRDFLVTRGQAAEVEWKEYDWRLNR